MHFNPDSFELRNSVETATIKTKRKRPSAVPGITSLALVMFMLGLFGFSVLGFHGLSQSLIESSSIDVYFRDSVQEPEVRSFMKDISRHSWLKNSKFVSREEGIRQMGDKYDEDFMQYVEVSELPLSVEIYFNASAASPESMARIAAELEKAPLVESVVYQKNLVESVNRNVQKIQWVLAGIAAIFIFIAIGLINNSTRLNIFANRFLIKSMQLVGATNGFIIRPFVWKFIRYALIAIPIAAALLFALLNGLHFIWKEFATIHEFTRFIDPVKAGMGFAAIGLAGIILAAISAWFSTRKYLRTKIENLY